MGRRILSSAATVLIFALVFSVQAQDKPQPSHQLIRIQVKGLHRFQPDDVIRTAGLRLGESADERDFKQASDRLGETGLFTHIHYRYQYSTAGCELVMEVEENDKLVPAVFENFVWLSDPELIRLARERLPLFQEALPLAGRFADQLASTLKAILAARGISGEVEYLPSQGPSGTIDSFTFRVTGHPILVDGIDFVGAAPTEAADLASAARPLLGQPYLRTKTVLASRSSFTAVYEARGYLKAGFSEPQVKVVQDGAKTLVRPSLRVFPGLEYRLSGLSITGNQVFPTPELERRIRLKTGEPANLVELKEDLAAIERLYGTRGYIAARVEPSAELDDSAAGVGYVLKISEGDLYRMGELKIEGLGDYAAQMISAQWQMKSGDPFDQSYLDRFFKITYRDIGLGSAWNVFPTQSISEKQKTVSVTLRFLPKA